jgi:hypothetical protein
MRIFKGKEPPGPPIAVKGFGPIPGDASRPFNVLDFLKHDRAELELEYNLLRERLIDLDQHIARITRNPELVPLVEYIRWRLDRTGLKPSPPAPPDFGTFAPHGVNAKK